MHVKHLSIHGFRGIRNMDWTVNGTMVGLVGPGDAGKTTILDALEYALWPRWGLVIFESDFTEGVPESPIEITVTVGDVPADLLGDEKYGMYKRGWRNGKAVDEPEDADEAVLTIAFRVTIDSETTWAVVTDRNPEGKDMTWRDRARLGVARLGDEVDRDLAWGRGSALSRLSETEGLEQMLGRAYRGAREVVAAQSTAELRAAAMKATACARRLGVAVEKDYGPGLDAAKMTIQYGALSLHDGLVPVRAAGLGTRRLVALAIQQAIVREGGILLIDELESGLEPHRVRHLVRCLRESVKATDSSQGGSSHGGQAILTTHSSVAVVELHASEVRVIHSKDGQVELREPGADLQDVIRATPEALLGNRIVVCEGSTEVGICRGMASHWDGCHSGETTAGRGVVFVDGGGSEAPRRAVALRNLGYRVAYFADSDKDIVPSAEDLEARDITVVRWDGKKCTEQRLCYDLTWTMLQKVVDLAIKTHGKASVVDAIASRLPKSRANLGQDLASWESEACDKQSIRQALGAAAKGTENRESWFKRIDLGEQVAEIIKGDLPLIPDSDLAKKLKALGDWCHEG